MYIFLLYSISRFRCLKNCQYSVSLVQLVGDSSINNVFPGFNTEAGCDFTDKVSTKKAALRPVYQSRKISSTLSSTAKHIQRAFCQIYISLNLVCEAYV